MRYTRCFRLQHMNGSDCIAMIWLLKIAIIRSECKYSLLIVFLCSNAEPEVYYDYLS